MPAVRRLIVLLAAVSLVAIAAGPAAGEGVTFARIYLLGADTDYLYWSVDADDPELDVPTITRRCGAAAYLDVVPQTSKPCLTGSDGGNSTYNLFFLPHTLLDEPAHWTTSSPLRFHLALHVSSPLAYTVSLTVQRGSNLTASGPATEVAPDTWEGTLGSGSPVRSDDPPFFGVQITTKAPAVELELRAAGASWLELPQPVPARPVSMLLSENPAPTTASSFASTTREFAFNDENWAIQSFSGDLSDVRSFQMSLDRTAVLVYAWVEGYTAPFLHDVLRGRPPDAGKVTDSPIITLYQDGNALAQNGYLFVGSNAVAAHDVSPGTVALRVERNGTLWPQDYPYKAHILAVYGARTLRSMEWDFSIDFGYFRTPVTQTCPFSGTQPIPLTSAVSTFDVRLYWDDSTPQDSRWTLEFWLPKVGTFQCGEAGTGPRVRFTLPVENDVWWMSPTPVQSTFVSAADTVFSMRVDYAYTPSVA